MQRPMSRDGELWEMVATASKRDWWREVFLFAMNIGKAEYVISLMKQHVLSRRDSSDDGDASDNDLGSLNLFSDAALENSWKNGSAAVLRAIASAGGLRHLQAHIPLVVGR